MYGLSFESGRARRLVRCGKLFLKKVTNGNFGFSIMAIWGEKVNHRKREVLMASKQSGFLYAYTQSASIFEPLEKYLEI